MSLTSAIACFFCAGEQTGYPSTDETKDDSLQELERINKEIETVRHEVEQEQRRLSRYQTVLADSVKTEPNYSVSKSETGARNVDGGTYGLSSRADSTRTYSRSRKYVVDNSKPRTDLEYDPLSNFSAGLRSGSSSGKEPKGKHGPGLKRSRNAAPCDQKKPVAHQSQLSQSPSPEPLDDSNEDSVLIIDIPPSPDRKRAKAQNPVDFQDEVEKVETEPVLLLDTSTFEKKRENNHGLFNYENKLFEHVPVDESAVNLAAYLEDVQSENQKINQFRAEKVFEQSPASPATTGPQDHNGNNRLVEKDKLSFQVDFPQCELPPSGGEMNPYHFPTRNSLFYDAPDATSNSPCGQHAEQVQTAEQPAQDRVSSPWSSALPQSQNTSSKMHGWFPGPAAAPESYPVPAEPLSLHSSASSLAIPSELSSASTGQLFVMEDADEEFIVIQSSSDEEELNYSELSDSDPMEECYRIFMEANEEKGNEEQPDVSVSTPWDEIPDEDVSPTLAV